MGIGIGSGSPLPLISIKYTVLEKPSKLKLNESTLLPASELTISACCGLLSLSSGPQ
ncbi:hypothetical protein D3C81_2050360 [compost metagenome]